MYDAFEKKVLDCINKKHAEIRSEIVKRFMQEMHQVPDPQALEGQEYGKLGVETVEFFGLKDTIGQEFYRGLVERFARDLFEVLIQREPSVSRLERFKEDLPNFLALGMFYIADQHQNENADIISESLNSSQFCQIILFPELAEKYEKAPYPSEVQEKLKQLTGLSKSFKRQAEQLIGKYGSTVLQILEKAFLGVVLPPIEMEAISIVTEKMGELLDGGTEPAFDLEALLNKKIPYKEEADSYKKVQEMFNQDIQALRLTLKRSFVRAVSLEKAFLAHEIKAIEDIVALLDEPAFYEFVQNNIYDIVPDRMTEVEQEQTQRALDRQAITEITNILDQVENGK